MIGPLLALAVLLASGGPASTPKQPPVEDCDADQGLTAFRSNLGEAVNKRDAEALLAMLAPDVMIDFGGDSGRDIFIEHWRPREVESQLWPILDRLLLLGCAGSESAGIIPWFGDNFFYDGSEETRDPDSFAGQAIVIQPGAKLREAPEAAARTITTLQWDVVWLIEKPIGIQTKVRLADGREGWLFDEQLYSPTDHRLLIEKRAGKWLITAFVAGD